MRMIHAAVIVYATVTIAGGCSDEECADNDLDGFGRACSNGEDCDDTNPLRTDNCDVVAAPACETEPTATGCPCIAGSTTTCYSGDSNTANVGSCVGGTASCVNGHWGICQGQVVPATEVCNGADDDCDGIVDNGVLSPCGGCDPSCQGGVWGQADTAFASTAELTTTKEGWLTLRRMPANPTALWVGNTKEDTVSRIDLETATETARYRSGGSEPVRLAVDYNGDVWIANRNFAGQSTLRKIAGDLSRCRDRNGNGITTSSGPTDILAEGSDECVLLTVPVGTGNPAAVARALAIDGDSGSDGSSGGDVWVGLHDSMQVIEVDGQSGHVLQTIPTPGFAPYQAVFDAWGTLWMISRDGLLARINRRQTAPEPEIIEVPQACYLLYGLGLDATERLVLTGFHCNVLHRFDPNSQTWLQIATIPASRGVVELDQQLWVAHTDGRISQIDADEFRVLKVFSLDSASAQPFESIAMASDRRDHVWVISSQNVMGEGGVATQFNIANREVSAQVPVGVGPHNQGDLTGGKLRGFFVAEGQASHVFNGCSNAGATNWRNLHIGADAGTSGTIAIALRHAANAASLPEVPYATVADFPATEFPIPLDLPSGGVLEVRVILRTSARDGAPRLRWLGIEWQCPGSVAF